MLSRRAVLFGMAVAVLSTAGCATGEGAVAQGGSFEFVSPGGQTDIFYDPPVTRETIGEQSGPDLMTNRTIAISDFAGKVVVLNVWGQRCGPCRAEVPRLKKVYAATKELRVQFLGIDVRDPQRDKAQDFVTDYQVTYPSIWDPPMRTLLALRGFPTSVVPATVVLDHQQRVAAVFLRQLLAADLQPVVERVAAER